MNDDERARPPAATAATDRPAGNWNSGTGQARDALVLEALPENPTIKQVAAFAQTHEQTVRRYIKTGQLRAFHVGTRSVRIDRASVAALFTEIAAP